LEAVGWLEREYGVSVCYRYLLNCPNCKSLRAVGLIRFVLPLVGETRSGRWSIVSNTAMSNMKAELCSFSFSLFLVDWDAHKVRPPL
jgi:hypothetical protein